MTQKRLPTAAQLKEMAQIDIHTVEQIKNPYCYLSNGVIVKISFAGRDTLEECLSRCIMSEKKL